MKKKSHERLERYINDRRLELRLKLNQVADLAGVSIPTLTALRKGHNVPTEDTKRGVEHALQWSAGSIDAILDGGEPAPVAAARLEATLPALQGHVTGTAHTRSEARPIGVRETPPADDTGETYEGDETEPDLERAFELLAEAQDLLAKVKRERRRGA